MAVQKSKKSRAKRGTRRAHDSLGTATLSINERGNLHRRHHIAEDGTYRGKQILPVKVDTSDSDEE